MYTTAALEPVLAPILPALELAFDDPATFELCVALFEPVLAPVLLMFAVAFDNPAFDPAVLLAILFCPDDAWLCIDPLLPLLPLLACPSAGIANIANTIMDSNITAILFFINLNNSLEVAPKSKKYIALLL